MSSKAILITGACGLVGAPLTKLLTERGDRVVGLDPAEAPEELRGFTHIQEKFGDGIMSAIDFTLEVDKVEDPKGDRVKITMCGKFLPYKKW